MCCHVVYAFKSPGTAWDDTLAGNTAKRAGASNGSKVQYLCQTTFKMHLYYQLGRTLRWTFVPWVNKSFKRKLTKIEDAIVFFSWKKNSYKT